MPLVTRDQRDGVTTLSLNRPDKLNALTMPMMDELRGHLDDITDDQGVRCLVLRAEGPSFCAGLDVAAAQKQHSSAFVRAAETIDVLEQLPYPTIGRIHGHCLTGGLELALACDLLIASSDAQLGDTHSRWDLLPVWGMSVRLPERIGTARAKLLSFTGRPIDGLEAANWGLVDIAVPPSDLDHAVRDVVAAVLSGFRASHAGVKDLYRARNAESRTEALRAERARLLVPDRIVPQKETP